jgi:thermitase
MKQQKKTTTKQSANRASARATKQVQASAPKRFNRRFIFAGAVAILVLLLGLAVSSLLPESSPLSLSSITGKNKKAPVIDTLTANYSVAGEASSSSLLVKYKSSVSEAARSKINVGLGGASTRHIKELGVDVVQVTSTESLGETIKKFKARGEVEYAEPNYLAKRFLNPNDTLFTKQWGLQKIDAPKAWDISQGGYSPIAIIDTGIAASQADLSGYVQSGFNFVNDTSNTHDDNGHGTHVAGIVSAASNNGTGVASIGFKGGLLPVKVLDSTGAGTYGDVATGIVYAADKGAKVLNLSLGGSSSSRTLQDAVKYAQSKGSVVVAAAGNNGNSTPVYPAAYPGVIAVSASTQDDTLASFSSYGTHIYVAAPGVSIVSTYNSGGYATLSGTSMAAPTVAGLIGLALSKGATSIPTIVSDLKTTSDKVGSYAYDSNGWNQYFGYGRINAAKLLGVVATGDTATTPTTPDEEDADKPTETARDQGQTNRSPRSQGKDTQFDVVVEGTVDSIDTDRSIVVVKVSSSSSNLELRDGNLIDLYITDESVVKSGGSTITFAELAIGDKLNIKAQWKDNKLNAKQVLTPAKPQNKGGQSNGRRP